MKWGGSEERKPNTAGLVAGVAAILVILGGLALLGSYGWVLVAP